MDQNSLVTEQLDAGSRFVAEFNKYATVQSAFWLKENEGDWQLYLSSDQITDENFDVGYGEVLRIVNQLKDLYIDPFDVNLIGTDDPLAIAVMEVKQRYPGRMATLVRECQIAGKEIEGLTIYESLMAVPSH